MSKTVRTIYVKKVFLPFLADSAEAFGGIGGFANTQLDNTPCCAVGHLAPERARAGEFGILWQASRQPQGNFITMKVKYRHSRGMCRYNKAVEVNDWIIRHALRQRTSGPIEKNFRISFEEWLTTMEELYDVVYE